MHRLFALQAVQDRLSLWREAQNKALGVAGREGPQLSQAEIERMKRER